MKKQDPVIRTRSQARAFANGATVQIEVPHLHHDTREFTPGARLHLRLLPFSLYPATAPLQPATGHDAVGVAATRHRTTAG